MSSQSRHSQSLASSSLLLVGINCFLFREPCQSLSCELPLAAKVAIHDCLALRMRLQPSLSAPKQLLNLVLPHPIVFVCVNHWNQNLHASQPSLDRYPVP